MSLKKAVECIRKNKNFLITTHTNLEGDALGSELAFYNLVRSLGKRATIVNQDGLPHGYEFLPKKDLPKRFGKFIKNKSLFDCFVALDCSDLNRAGLASQLKARGKTTLNIDHHVSNKWFADVNWVEPDYSCCCEMIYRLYKFLHVPLDRETALFLYIGILTDTGSFRYSNANSRVHKAVSELLEFGLDVPQIYASIYKNIPFRDIQWLTKVLPGIRLTARGRIAWFQIKRAMLNKQKLSFDLTEAILSFARAIKGVEVTALFREMSLSKDEVRLNLRSQGKVDVNRIASIFGGGGHKTASGATLHGPIESVRKKVLAKIKGSLS